MTIMDLSPGESAVITKMLPGGGAIRRRLLDMGVTRGTSLRVTRLAPLGDPIEIEIKGYGLAIRRNEASFIEVERDG
jgi:ferrous iron transport protein A